MPEEASSSYTYNLTQDYLEGARAALTPIHGKVPQGAEKPPPSNDLLNAVFSVVSVSIVYSFLALESFLNYQLFRLWERRGDGSEIGKKFVAELGDAADFIKLKNNDKVREVPARLKTLCKLLGYPAPYEAVPDAWRRLNELVETSRHFVVHPLPDREFFQQNMLRIMQETQSGAYVRVVEEVLAYLYTKGGKPVPPWVTSNQLIQFRGIDLLPVQGRE